MPKYLLARYSHCIQTWYVTKNLVRCRLSIVRHRKTPKILHAYCNLTKTRLLLIMYAQFKIITG